MSLRESPSQSVIGPRMGDSSSSRWTSPGNGEGRRSDRRPSWCRCGLDGEFADHPEGPVVLAEELDEPRLGERHLNRALLTGLDVDAVRLRADEAEVV